MLSIYIITIVYACPLTRTLANTAHCRTFKFLLIQELILIYIPWDLVESITCSNTFFPLAVGSDFILSICRSSLYIPGINPLYFMSWKCFILFCLSWATGQDWSKASTESSGSPVSGGGQKCYGPNILMNWLVSDDLGLSRTIQSAATIPWTLLWIKKKKDSQDCASCQTLRESTVLNQLPSNIKGSRLNNEGILLENTLPIQAFIHSLQPNYLRTEFLASAFLKSLKLTSTYPASWLTAVPDSLWKWTEKSPGPAEY